MIPFSLRTGRARLAAAALSFGLVSTAFVVPALAAAGDPTVTAKDIGDGLIVASLKNFPATTDIEIAAEIEGGGGDTSATANADGRAVVAFQLPDGFGGGIVRLTAESGSVSKTATVSVGAAVAEPVKTTQPIVNDEVTATNGTEEAGVTEKPEPTTGTATLTSGSGKWLSGGAGSVGSGEFGKKRGAEAESASTWSNGDCTQQGALTGEYGSWNKPLVNAVGGMKEGDSWSSAAGGGLDGYWTSCLNAIKSGWGDRDESMMIISLFHESNGNWYPWSVGNNDLADFKAAFHRFRQLQQEIMPGAKMTLAVNANSHHSIPLEEFVPNAEDYDFYSVDYYSMHHGMYPLDQHLAIAKAEGKPLILQEWGWKGKDAAQAAGMAQYVYDFISKNAGSGPGQVYMDNYFDIDAGGESDYRIESVPSENAVYNKLWVNN